MKTKLLKKLRRKFSKKYCITRYEFGYKVWDGKGDISCYRKQTIQEAYKLVKELIEKDIKKYIEETREKRDRKHGIKYYPWAVKEEIEI